MLQIKSANLEKSAYPTHKNHVRTSIVITSWVLISSPSSLLSNELCSKPNVIDHYTCGSVSDLVKNQNIHQTRGFLTLRSCAQSGDFKSCKLTKHALKDIVLYVHEDNKVYSLNLDQASFSIELLDKALGKNNVTLYGQRKKDSIEVLGLTFPSGKKRMWLGKGVL